MAVFAAGVKAEAIRPQRSGPAASARNDKDKQKRRADGVRILAVGARHRPAWLELGHELGKPLAMRRPQDRGLAARGGAEAVLIGGGRPVLDAGVPLEPAQRLVRGSAGEADQRQEARRGTQCRSREQQPAMEKRRHDAPQIEQRHNEKDRDHEERPEQRLPDALAEQAQASLRRTRHSKRRASALSSDASGDDFFAANRFRIFNRLTHNARAVTRVTWGAKQAKGGLISPTRASANRAAAPPPACRRSSVLAASRIAISGDQHLRHQEPAIIL